MTVHKYELPITDMATIRMPVGARILSLQAQANVPCIWALVDLTAPMVARTFAVYGTGYPIRALVASKWPFVGSVLIAGGSLVFHVFDGGEQC